MCVAPAYGVVELPQFHFALIALANPFGRKVFFLIRFVVGLARGIYNSRCYSLIPIANEPLPR